VRRVTLLDPILSFTFGIRLEYQILPGSLNNSSCFFYIVIKLTAGDLAETETLVLLRNLWLLFSKRRLEKKEAAVS